MSAALRFRRPPRLAKSTLAMLAFRSDEPKSMLVAYLLLVSLGALGGHRYYVGKVGTGLAMFGLTIVGIATTLLGVGLLFLAAVGIWIVVDAVQIPRWIGRRNDPLGSRLG